MKQSDNGPDDKVPDLKVEEEGGHQTKTLLLRLKDLEVSPSLLLTSGLTWGCWVGFELRRTLFCGQIIC